MKRHATIEVRGLALHSRTYRLEAYRQARHLNIQGYVKFCIPNELVIDAEGEEEQLQEYVFWCEKTLTSSKTQMHAEFSDILLNYNEFRILSI